MKYLENLKYFISESIYNLWYAKGVNSISIATIAISLYIIGIFLLLMANATLFFNALSEKAQIDIYLKDDISDSEREEIALLLEEDGIVKSFQFIPKPEALQRFKKDFPDLKDIPEELEDNPIPASFEVALSETGNSEDTISSFIRKFSRLDGIEDIQCDREWIKKLGSYLNLMKGGGILLGGILYFAAAFTISSVIRLNVYSRRDEIEIMRLVGATNSFIRGPFLAEGVLQGLIAAFLSVAALYGTYWFFIAYSRESYSILLGFFTSTFITLPQFLLVVVSGMAIGLAGSFLSIRRFLTI
ncbi:MAG: permease-like cell division protein FtsX [Acidobacteriota bacterium]